jgi:hypothetical protein
MRWQLELEIKRDMSIDGRDKLPTFVPATTQIWLYVKLLLQQTGRRIVAEATALPPPPSTSDSGPSRPALQTSRTKRRQLTKRIVAKIWYFRKLVRDALRAILMFMPLQKYHGPSMRSCGITNAPRTRPSPSRWKISSISSTRTQVNTHAPSTPPWLKACRHPRDPIRSTLSQTMRAQLIQRPIRPYATPFPGRRPILQVTQRTLPPTPHRIHEPGLPQRMQLMEEEHSSKRLGQTGFSRPNFINDPRQSLFKEYNYNLASLPPPNDTLATNGLDVAHKVSFKDIRDQVMNYAIGAITYPKLERLTDALYTIDVSRRQAMVEKRMELWKLISLFGPLPVESLLIIDAANSLLKELNSARDNLGLGVSEVNRSLGRAPDLTIDQHGEDEHGPNPNYTTFSPRSTAILDAWDLRPKLLLDHENRIRSSQLPSLTI